MRSQDTERAVAAAERCLEAADGGGDRSAITTITISH
jgi:hypothetical protein